MRSKKEVTSLNTYVYKAISVDQQLVTGSIEAVDEYAAMAELKTIHLVVIELKQQKEKTGLLAKEIGTPKVKEKDLAVLSSQLGIIIKSGVPVDHALQLVSRQTKDKYLRKILLKSSEDITKGEKIADSLAKNGAHLPPTFIETIRAGEESGTLEHSFMTLQEYYEKSFKTKQKVKQALAYPVFVLIIAAVVLAIVMVKVIPSMQQTFDDLGGDIPALTKGIIALSNGLQKYGILILLLILLVVIAMKFLLRSEGGKIYWGKVKMNLPIIGNIQLLSGAGQFAYTMAALLSAGINVSESLRITGKAMDVHVMGEEVQRMTKEIEEGRSLAQCMSRSVYLPETLKEMCVIGEETGELESTLKTVADYYNNETQYATKKALQLLEPALLIFLAVMVGGIVIAIYLPMFQMYELI